MDKLLIEAKNSFAKLQKNGGRPTSQMKTMALQLLERYSRQFVSESLGIIANNLTNWRRRAKDNVGAPVDFIELPANHINTKDTIPAEKIKNSEKLTLTFPNKVSLAIEVTSIDKIGSIINKIVKDFS